MVRDEARPLNPEVHSKTFRGVLVGVSGPGFKDKTPSLTIFSPKKWGIINFHVKIEKLGILSGVGLSKLKTTAFIDKSALARKSVSPLVSGTVVPPSN